MAKTDLQKVIREHGGFILSDGTLNLEHLLPKAYDLINNYGIQAKQLQDDILQCFTGEIENKQHSLYLKQYYSEIELREDNKEFQSEIWNEDIFNFFNNISPKGYYFGSSEGDGACIGWFAWEDETK